MTPPTRTLNVGRLSCALPLLVLFLGIHVGCGGAAASGGGSTVPPPPNEADAGVSDAEATAQQTVSDVESLATDVIAPQICPHLIGSFVGLPGNEEAAGRAAGTLASEGRWWIRQCDAHVADGHLDLRIAGMGWTWVSQESSGFRIQQYLMFEAEAHLVTSLEVAYDHDARVATLWMRPVAPAEAHITPRGVVSPGATNVVSSFFSAVASGVVSDSARTQVEQIGSERLATRLGAGFTMTVALDRQQLDFMVGALPRGQTPERPFPDVAGAPPWIVNQRARVQPGGLDVVGPIDAPAAGAPPLSVDVDLEEGPGVVVRAACADDVHAVLDARLLNPTSNPPVTHSRDLLRTATVDAPQHLPMPHDACPLLLLVSLPDGATLASRYRLRIAPEPAATQLAGTTAPPPTTPLRVRVRLSSVTISPHDPSGSAWDVDMLGHGAPDVYAIVYSVARSHELIRAPQLPDVLDAQWNLWLPGTYDPLADLPIRFTVMDSDVTHDEIVGTAVLNRSDVPLGEHDLELPLLGDGATAPRTGSLHLHFQPIAP